MHQRTLIVIFFIAFFAIAARASDEKTYKCGNTYSQTPCPGGIAIDAQDPRTPAQVSQSKANANRDANLAKTMSQERLKQEALDLKARKAAEAANAPKQEKASAPKPHVRKKTAPKPPKRPASGAK